MIDDRLPSLCQTRLRGQGKVSSPRHSCLCSISICQGPARGRDAARRAGCSRLPEAYGQSSEWQGCVLQGLLNVVGWAAGRVMTPCSDATVRLSGKGVKDHCLSPGSRCLDWKGCWVKTRRIVSAGRMSLRVTGILRQGEGLLMTQGNRPG